jgi:hypothetical protein
MPAGMWAYDVAEMMDGLADLIAAVASLNVKRGGPKIEPPRLLCDVKIVSRQGLFYSSYQ